MFSRPPFLFGGLQFDLFERTSFLFFTRSTGQFVSAEDLGACQLLDFELDACEVPDVGLNAVPNTDLELQAVLGDLDVEGTPGTDFTIGAQSIGDLDLLAEHRPDEELPALQVVDLSLEGMRLLDCDLDALALPVDLDLDAEVADFDLDAEITNS